MKWFLTCETPNVYRGHFNWKKSVLFGQLAFVAWLVAQPYAGTQKSLKDFWPAVLEQLTKFVLTPTVG